MPLNFKQIVVHHCEITVDTMHTLSRIYFAGKIDLNMYGTNTIIYLSALVGKKGNKMILDIIGYRFAENCLEAKDAISHYQV